MTSNILHHIRTQIIVFLYTAGEVLSFYTWRSYVRTPGHVILIMYIIIRNRRIIGSSRRRESRRRTTTTKKLFPTYDSHYYRYLSLFCSFFSFGQADLGKSNAEVLRSVRDTTRTHRACCNTAFNLSSSVKCLATSLLLSTQVLLVKFLKFSVIK